MVHGAFQVFNPQAVHAKLRKPGSPSEHSLQERCRTVRRTPSNKTMAALWYNTQQNAILGDPGPSLRKRLTRHHRLQAGQLLWLELPKEAAHHLQAPSTTSATTQSLLAICKHNHEGAGRACKSFRWQKHSPMLRFTPRHQGSQRASHVTISRKMARELGFPRVLKTQGPPPVAAGWTASAAAARPCAAHRRGPPARCRATAPCPAPSRSVPGCGCSAPAPCAAPARSPTLEMYINHQQGNLLYKLPNML